MNLLLEIWLKEPNFFFSRWLQELIFFEYNSQNWTPISNTSHRIEPFLGHDSQNWTLFSTWLIEINPFFLMWPKDFFTKILTHRNDWSCLEKRLKELNPFCFFQQWLKGLNSLWMTHWIEPLFMNLFSYWLKEFFSIWREELNLSCFQYDSKNWNFFFQNAQGIEPLFHMNYFFNHMTQRIEPFFVWVQNWIFSKKKQESPSPKMTQRIEPFRNMTHRIEFFVTKKTDRIEPFFSLREVNLSFQHDSKNVFFLIDSKKLNRISRRMTQRIEPCVKRSLKEWNFFFDSEVKNCILSFSTWLAELNLFLEYDPQNWTFFQYDWKNSELITELNFFFGKMTQRIEPFCFFQQWLKGLNLLVIRLTELNFFLIRLKELNLLLEIWFKEPNFFFSRWLQEMIFLNISHRIEHLFRIQLTELNLFFFLTWLTELNPFCNMTHRNWTHFLNVTQRICVYKNFVSQKWLILSGKMTQSIEPFLFFSTVTQRIELFVNDSLNWASFMNLFSIRVELFFLLTQRIEPSLNVTQRVEFFERD